jgi:radical SAM superfamily enzyme YgiQ (UPF0313 family)
MKITLIQPAMGRESDAFVESWKMEPLSMAVLAGLTPDRHEVRFFDDRVEPLDLDAPTDLVAISVETYTARRAYQIARAFRQRGVKVVLGGYHATLVPDEVRGFADAVVYGEAEPVWERLLADAEAGCLQPAYRAEGRPAVYSVKADRSIFAGKRYMPLTLVETGRGCNFVCDFCSVTSYFRQQVRWRPADEVAAEIASTGRRRVFLVDDNLTTDFARAKELFRAIEPLKIHWLSQATINTGTDDELCRLMQRSGCAGILVGFESLGEDTLKSMRKQFNQGAGKFRDALARLRDHGLKIYATFVFGYDTDTPDLFERTLDFAMEQKFFVTAFNHMQPFPGTPLYARMEAEGRLLYPRWWLEPSYRFGQIVFRPRLMEPDQLYQKLRETRARFFSWSSILSRATDFKANCRDPRAAWYHFAVNAILKKELNEKWATPLGDLGQPDPLGP